jgi:cytoskeletal protein RodZ
MTTPSDRPVFVDPSGRRRKVMRIAMGAVAVGVLAYLVLLVVALAGGPVNPTTLLPIPEAAEPAVTTTTDTPAPSPEATSLPRNETTTTPPATTTTPPVATTTTATTTAENGNKRTDPPGASNRPSEPGQGKP